MKNTRPSGSFSCSQPGGSDGTFWLNSEPVLLRLLAGLSAQHIRLEDSASHTVGNVRRYIRAQSLPTARLCRLGCSTGAW